MTNPVRAEAFEYILANGGLDGDDEYSYLGSDDEMCWDTAETRHLATMTSYEDVPSGDEAALVAAAAVRPVAVAIEADQAGFQNYKSGIYDDASCGTNLDHGTGHALLPPSTPKAHSTPHTHTLRCVVCVLACVYNRRARRGLRQGCLPREEQLGRRLGRERLHPNGAQCRALGHLRNHLDGQLPTHQRQCRAARAAADAGAAAGTAVQLLGVVLCHV